MGKNGYAVPGALSYQGVTASNPPQLLVKNRAPQSIDDQNFDLGTIWLVYNDSLSSPSQIWMLVRLDATDTPGKALWVNLYPGQAGLTIYADDGKYVEPDSNGDIYLLGQANTNIVTSVPGISGTDTMRISLSNNPVIENIKLTDLDGGPVFSDEITGFLYNSNGTDGQLILGKTAGIADWGNLTSDGGTVAITYDSGDNTLNFEATGVAGLVQLTTDNGVALPAAGNINVVGKVGNSISTTAMDAANTVSIFLNDDVDINNSLTLGFTGSGGPLTVNNLGVVSATGTIATTYTSDAGTATPASNNLNVLGGTNISTAGAGSTLVVALDDNVTLAGNLTLSLFGAGVVQTNASGQMFSNNGTNGQVLIGGGTVPTWSTITAGAGISVTNAANSITIAAVGGGTGAASFPTDSGTATQSGSVLNVLGDNLVTTEGSGNTVTVKLTETGTNGQIPISATGGAPTWATLTAGSGVSITNAANSITIAAAGGGGGGLLVANTDSGSATVNVSNELDIVGGDNINTEGAADVLIINLDESILLPATNSSGTTGVIALGPTSVPTDRFVHNYGTNNTFIGHSAGNLSLTTISATGNTALGKDSLSALTTGASNTGAGFGALAQLESGDNNVALGVGAGYALTTNDSDNIIIGNAGNAGWNNMLVIGGGTGTGAGEQNETTIYGIYDRPVTANIYPVLIDDTEVLGTDTGATLADGDFLIAEATGGWHVGSLQSTGASVTITYDSGTGNINLEAAGVAALTALKADDTNTATPTAGVINIYGTNLITTTASGSTLNVGLTTTGTNGQIPISNNSGNVSWANITAGTGISVSNGANSITIANTATGVATVTAGDNINFTGTPTNPIVNFDKYIHTWGDTTAAGTNGVIQLNTVPFMHAYSSVASQLSKNTFLGYAAGNFTSVGATNNVGIGLQALTSLTSGDNNCVIGDNAGVLLSSSSGNVIIGADAMDSATSGCDNNVVIGRSAMTSATTNADNNIAIGYNSLSLLTGGDGNISIGEGDTGAGITTGSNNIVVGNNSYAQTTSNSCIIIGNNQTVLTGNDGAIRIGTSGSSTGSTVIGRALTDSCTIGGIYNKSVSAATRSLVVNDSTGLLGNLSISANSVVGKGPTGNLTSMSIVDTSTVTATITNFSIGFNTVAQSAFLAIQNFNVTNVTGDGTLYELGKSQAFTEIFDNTNAFYPGNGTTLGCKFTAPITGKYWLQMLIQATNLPMPTTPASTPRDPMDIITSNRTYVQEPLFLGSSTSTTQSYSFSVLADMDAGDTCIWKWSLEIPALTKTVGCGASTFVSGYLAVGA